MGFLHPYAKDKIYSQKTANAAFPLNYPQSNINIINKFMFNILVYI